MSAHLEKEAPLLRRPWAPLAYHSALLGLAIAAVAVPLFHRMLFSDAVSDHPAHLGFIVRGATEGGWPAHFLFHWTVFALSGLSREHGPLAVAALVVLTLAVLGKALIALGTLVARVSRQVRLDRVTQPFGATGLTIVTLAALSLMAVSPIINPWNPKQIYIGQFSPNVWHNPTLLFVWPLALGLFFASLRCLTRPGWRWLAVTGSLAVLNALAKPNYLLAWLPAFALLALVRLRPRRRLLAIALALLPAVGVLAWQFGKTYLVGSAAGSPSVGRELILAPLAAWRLYTPTILGSCLVSLAFPALYAALFRHDVRKRDDHLLAWLIMAAAMLWMGLVAETQPGLGLAVSFNSSWAAHAAVFALFLVVLADLVGRQLRALGAGASGDGRMRAVWLVYGLHLVSGGVYYLKQLVGYGYF